MPKNVYEASCIFFIYAFLGWICEVIFAALEGRSLDRGMLFGPVCPIYGFAMLAIIFALYPLKDKVFLLFVGAVILTTAIELTGGFILEKIFHERWWDYSDIRFNLNGYICLKFSLLWGIGATLVVGAVHPRIYSLVEKVPIRFGLPILITVSVIFAVDFVLTVINLIRLPEEMHALAEMERSLQQLSNKMSGMLGGVTVAAANKGGEWIEEPKDKLIKLKEEYTKKLEEFKKTAENKGFTKNRIFKAFPDLKKGKFKPVFDRLSSFRQKGERDETE